MSLQETEKECAANAKGPRISLVDIAAAIKYKYFLNAADMVSTLPLVGGAGSERLPELESMTICMLVMQNGFIVIGKSCPADPVNYNKALGEKLAYEDAVRQLWPLMGFVLRELIHIKAPLDGLLFSKQHPSQST